MLELEKALCLSSSNGASLFALNDNHHDDAGDLNAVTSPDDDLRAKGVEQRSGKDKD